ncbi:MAG TPA: hypothetical protein VH024_04550 [Candidatus Angelobacter sp.]|nr:hypothetical protein [Candidatus Angelobacter sp.]
MSTKAHASNKRTLPVSALRGLVRPTPATRQSLEWRLDREIIKRSM